MNIEKRITAFEKLGLGLFVHYGLYSQLRKGEWAWWYGRIERNEYLKTLDTFDARNFDAGFLVRLAKSAGMKYLVFTARHHDGFSLYDMRGLNEYDSLHTPCGRDLVGEVVDACHKNGIVPFIYHTTWD
jgi:alpha-L-fucosidase